MPTKGPNDGEWVSPAEGLEGRRPTRESTDPQALVPRHSAPAHTISDRYGNCRIALSSSSMSRSLSASVNGIGGRIFTTL